MLRNTSRITPELCSQARLLFFPRTEQEAALIQQAIFNLGYHWARNESQEISDTKICVEKGLVLKKGELYTEPSVESFTIGLVCTLDQFAKNYLSPEEALEEKFNRLSARIARLEEMVAEIHAAVIPPRPDKIRPRLEPKP